ncbi:MAG: methyl-accepting chemotaxis protein [Chloroflexota bacterium]|nr:methyl-accepting chemotaxis protein [Chloroflexota bacterium]
MKRQSFVVVLFQQLNWSVTRKVTICFLTLLVIIIISSTLVFINILNQETSSAAERQKSLALTDARTFKELFQSQLNAYGDAIYLTQQRTINSSYSLQSQDSLTRMQLDEPDKFQNPASLLSRLVQSYKELDKVFTELNRLLQQQNLAKSDQLWSTNLALRNAVISNIEIYLKELEQESQQFILDSRASSTFTKATALITGLLGVVCTIFLAWLLSSTLGRPLALTRQYLEKVSAGDFSQTLQLSNQDELGDLVKALNLSVGTFRGLLEGVMLGEDIEKAVINLKLVSRKQAEYVTRQASFVTQVYSSMQELNKTAQLISEGASEVADAAQHTLVQVHTVNGTSKEVSTAVQQLKQVVESAIEQIETANSDFSYLIGQLNRLDQQSHGTESIVHTVTDLAHQTHLLALNASIEAAGAGAQGQRFGVIAQEVKSLAARSSQAADQIRNLISTTRQSIQHTRQQAEERQANIGKVVNMGTRVEETMQMVHGKVAENQQAAQAILKAAENSTYQAQQIKSSSLEQQAASAQIVTSLDSITESVNIGAEGSNQVAATSSQLSVIANTLTTRLAELKLPVANGI